MLLQWLQLPCDPEDQLDQPYQHTVSKPAAFPYLTLIHLAEISTRKKPWRCDRCGFSTGHRGSLSRHRKNGRCGVSTSTPVNSSSHNDYYQSDGPIASPLPTSSTSSSYPAVIAPLAIAISPYAGMAPDQYGLPSFPHQLLPLPVLPEMEGLESNPPTWPLSNVSPLSQPAWTVADAMQASYCEYQDPSVMNTPLPSIEDTLSLTRIHIDYHV